MNKIQCVSRYFRLLFQLIFILSPLALIGWVFAPGVLHLNFLTIDIIPESYRNQILIATFPLHTKLLGFLVSLVPLMINLLMFYYLVMLFKLYEKGEIFSLNNVNYIRKVGYALLAGQLIQPLYQFILSAILTWHNPPGYKFAMFKVGTSNLGIVMVALLIILVSWIMAEGCHLREEQQLTI